MKYNNISIPKVKGNPSLLLHEVTARGRYNGAATALLKTLENDRWLLLQDVSGALSCKVGGLFISRHDEIKDELGQLDGKALKPSAIHNKPLINNGRKVECSSDAPTGTDCIVDVRITDLDSKSYQKKSNNKVLAGQEQEKKRKYLAPCIANRRHFTPFVSSTDGLIGKEGQTFAKRLAGLLSEKRQRPSYSQVCGYVNARLSIALVRATHRCLRGSRVPAPLISVKYAQREDGAGLNLWR
eukprot:scaffold56867_cov40-Attheya_sp.AAC.1